MKRVLAKAGFIVEDNKVFIPKQDETLVSEYLERASYIIQREQELNDLYEEEMQEEELVIDARENENSKVDLWEKIIQDKNGEDVLVRLSIVKQDAKEEQFDRLVNVTYVSKQTGIVTSNQVFGYEDGYQFDQDVLPQIIDGFTRNISLSGKEITVDEKDSTKCYLTAGEDSDSIYLEGYYVDGIRSLIDYDKEYNLFGDEEGQIYLSDLQENNIVSDVDTYETFEENVSNQNEQEQDGPKLSKSLGEMPVSSNAIAGFSNWMNLLMFLCIDVVAIVVGFYLLLH